MFWRKVAYRGRKAKIRGENDIWGRKRLIFEEKSCLGVKMADLGEKMIENGGRKCQIFRLEAVLCGKNVQFPGTEVVFRGENTQHGAERGYSGGEKDHIVVKSCRILGKTVYLGHAVFVFRREKCHFEAENGMFK